MSDHYSTTELYTLYSLLAISSLSIPPLIYLQTKKSKLIKLQKSFSRISIWLQNMTILNLLFQLAANVAQLVVLFGRPAEKFKIIKDIHVVATDIVIIQLAYIIITT